VQSAKALPRNPGSGQRIGKREARRIDCFVGELERAVVVRKRNLRPAVDESLHRLGRVHVLVAHEPARFIGPDRQDCELKRSVALAHHHGTFQLTDEAIDAPVTALGEALKQANIPPERFAALKPGQVYEI